jgi:predicted glycosyltransferase
MRIWIDLANSPHVPFFSALREEFLARGHELEVTARAFAQTVELAEMAGLSPTVIGAHGGRELAGKAGNLFGRARALRSWARTRRFDLAVSHNSYSQIIAARALRVPSVTLMDYEHQPANHLAFRLASRIIVPRAFPAAALRRYGASKRKVRRYDGYKEDVYLADWQPDAGALENLLESLGVSAEEVLIVVRPPARDALYHRFDNELFDALVEHLCAQDEARIVLLARTDAQREEFDARHRSENVILPETALDGATLIAAADLVISAGGTMNREAAALGVPAVTVYAGQWAAVDEELMREGRLRRIRTREDIQHLRVAKKDAATNARRAPGVRAQVAEMILE